jgi:hypothetical protein
MGERVEKADDMGATGVVFVGLDDAFEEFNLVQSRFRVVGGRPDDLESNMLTVGIVF